MTVKDEIDDLKRLAVKSEINDFKIIMEMLDEYFPDWSTETKISLALQFTSNLTNNQIFLSLEDLNCELQAVRNKLWEFM